MFLIVKDWLVQGAADGDEGVGKGSLVRALVGDGAQLGALVDSPVSEPPAVLGAGVAFSLLVVGGEVHEVLAAQGAVNDDSAQPGEFWLRS